MINSVSSLASSGQSGLATITYGSIYLAALFLIIAKWNSIKLLSRGLRLYFLFIAFVLITSIWSAYPYKVILTAGHFTGLLLIVLCAHYAVHGRTEYFYRTILFSSIIVLLVSLILVYFYPSQGLDPQRDLRWRGVTTNPNTLGVAALVTIWSATALVSKSRTKTNYILFALGVSLGLSCIYGTNSMTSAILSVFVLVGMPILGWAAKKGAVPLVLKVIVLLFIFTTGIMTLLIIIPAITNPEYALQIVGRSTTLSGRIDIWKLAMEAISLRPWLGWGFDAHSSVSQALRMDIGQFHNGYLDVLVKGGVVGLVLCLFFVFITMNRVLKASFRATPEFVTFTIYIIVFLLHNVTEATLGRERTELWLLFIIIYFYMAQPIGSHEEAQNSKRMEAVVGNKRFIPAKRRPYK